MAVFNLDYYKGMNLYSDGDVENVILNIIRSGQDYTRYAGSDNYYAIMYHLSPERENILNWYPFKKTDTILEVGAGCGAITGLFCRNAKWVTSVELSKRRAEINYERHKSYENLEIIVGNLNEIDLEKKYDYIILNGVFEYAISFTDSEQPYVSFLRNLKQYLTENGKVLIAIENRLGIKYFAGASEDHTNEYYVGLRNYPENRTVRTFSKTELEEIFKKCDMGAWKFYYPYPDYKFPTEIFTDENINSDNFGRGYRNYQKDRIEIFNEIEMIKTLKNEKIMNVFSNSFLVEVGAVCLPPSDVVYAKLNSTRKQEFCISTTILRKGTEYIVEKAALNQAAQAHIEHIYANQNESLPQNFRCLEGRLQGDKVIYPYLSQKNLDVCLSRMLDEGKKEEIKRKFDGIYDSFMNAASMKNDFIGVEFKTYFGDALYEGGLECVENCNIDLIFDNLYPTNEGYIVIDTEWVCPFWVPAKFIVWRMINEWYAKYPMADKLLPSKELYDAYGIAEEMTRVFRQWAIHFATKYVSYNDLDNAIIPITFMDVNVVLRSYESSDELYSSLYIDYGEGFSEVGKSGIKIKLNNKRFNFKVLLDSSKTISALRWDPTEFKFCKCSIEKCILDGRETPIFPVNAGENDSELFLNIDPQFIIKIAPGNYSLLEICGYFEYLGNDFVAENIQRLNQSNVGLQNTNVVLRKENESMNVHNAQMKQDITVLQATNEALQNENENINMNNVQLKQDNAILQATNEALRNENESINMDSAQVKRENAILQATNEALRNENKNMNVQMKQGNAILQAAYETLRNENESISVKNTILQSANEALQNENENISANYDHIMQDYENITMQKESLILALKNLEDELNAIKNSKSWRVLNIWRKMRGMGKNV